MKGRHVHMRVQVNSAGVQADLTRYAKRHQQHYLAACSHGHQCQLPEFELLCWAQRQVLVLSSCNRTTSHSQDIPVSTDTRLACSHVPLQGTGLTLIGSPCSVSEKLQCSVSGSLIGFKQLRASKSKVLHFCSDARKQLTD